MWPTRRRFPFRHIRHFFNIEYGVIAGLAIAVLLPLRHPTGRSYHYSTIPEMPQDIQMCSIARYSENSSLWQCEQIPSNLEFFKHVDKNLNMTGLSLMAKSRNIHPGGRWHPTNCIPWQKVAIIVPYRAREKQLNHFLQHMHPFLQAQLLDYTIFIIEQTAKYEFNRGKLLNIGFMEAAHDPSFCCFIFHDVDLLPESPMHIYGCSQDPRHMCSAIDIFRYVLPYPELFGGVVAFTKEQFELVNGYSNLYFGWGGEDDDLSTRDVIWKLSDYTGNHSLLSPRVAEKKLRIGRWDPRISRYTMLQHKKAVPNPDRYMLLRLSNERIERDGLSSLSYKVKKFELRPLYTWYLVDVDT